MELRVGCVFGRAFVAGAESDDQIVGDEVVADPQLTELVAYLDGELPAEVSERLEQRLAGDASLRRQAADLDRTWQMLNMLEEVPASAEFVSKTLATIEAMPGVNVVGDAVGLGGVSGLIRNVRVLSAVAGMILGFAGTSLGLFISRDVGLEHSPQRDMEILEGLDLLRSYPQLRAIPDEAFLRELAAASAAGGNQ